MICSIKQDRSRNHFRIPDPRDAAALIYTMSFLGARWNYCTPMSFMPRVYWKCNSMCQPNDGPFWASPAQRRCRKLATGSVIQLDPIGRDRRVVALVRSHRRAVWWEGGLGVISHVHHSRSDLLNNPTRPVEQGTVGRAEAPLKPKDVWSIRARLEIDGRERDLALFNLAIDSKLRASDLVSLKVADVQIGGRARERTTIIQQKTARPVQFELTDNTRKSVQAWLARLGLGTRVPVPRRNPTSLSSLDASIRPSRPRLGIRRRPRQPGLWDAFNAAHEGSPDLS